MASDSDMELLSPHDQAHEQGPQMRTRSMSWLNLSSRSEMGERGRRWSVVSLASSGYTTGATDSPASLSVSSAKHEHEREESKGRERRERERGGREGVRVHLMNVAWLAASAPTSTDRHNSYSVTYRDSKYSLVVG